MNQKIENMRTGINKIIIIFLFLSITSCKPVIYSYYKNGEKINSLHFEPIKPRCAMLTDGRRGLIDTTIVDTISIE